MEANASSHKGIKDTWRKYWKPVLLLLAIEACLLHLFPVSLIFSTTVITGGDTASHYPTAAILRERLLSGESLFTWVFGNYAGFPLFLHYFPLPFVLIVLISLALPLQAAFKLGTLLAVFPLPLASFACLRRLGYGMQSCLIGAAFSAVFLLTEETSMWGGNIASTLAGEFAYGISLALAIYLTGLLYRDATEGRSLFRNAFLEALVALSHGYPLLQTGFGTFFFFLRYRTIPYILCLHALAFGIASFWLLPLIWRIPWDTSFNYAWNITSWKEVVPPVLLPALAGIPAGWAVRLFRRADVSTDAENHRRSPEGYILWQAGIALLFYGLAPRIGLVDIRFLPFAQIYLLLLGAIGWGKVIRSLRYAEVWVALTTVCYLVAVVAHLDRIPRWIEWNYSGFEATTLWPAFRDLNGYLRGSENESRVFYEHAEENNQAGTVRAFEMLPFFSGRSTLEGLYMQSSISSPFVFYLQSELSHAPSCPLPMYYYSRFNLDRAAEHLKLFNADRIITITGKTQSALDRSARFLPDVSIPPFRVYRIAEGEYTPSYVTPLRYQPYRIPFKGWKEAQFEWFRKSSLSVPLVVPPTGGTIRHAQSNGYWQGLPVWEGPMDQIPQEPLEGGDSVEAEGTLGDNRITVHTSKVMHPLWLKVSYHPDWQITGGKGELYLASPSFMLLVPHTPEVELRFTTTGGVYAVGKALTVTALCIVLAVWFTGKRNPPPARPAQTPCSRGSFRGMRGRPESSPVHVPVPGAAWVLLGLLLAATLFHRSERDPLLLYHKALEAYAEAQQAESGDAAERYDAAQRIFLRCIDRFPLSPVVDHCAYYAGLIYMKQERWQDVADFFSEFLWKYPDTSVRPEVLYHLGLTHKTLGRHGLSGSYFRRLLALHPESPWAEHAAVRLMEAHASPDALLQEAREHFDRGDYAAAIPLLDTLSRHGPEALLAESALLSALCRFHESRWEEAARRLSEWLTTYPDHPETSRALVTLAKCRLSLSQYDAARSALQSALEADPDLAQLLSFRAMLAALNDVSPISGEKH